MNAKMFIILFILLILPIVNSEKLNKQIINRVIAESNCNEVLEPRNIITNMNEYADKIFGYISKLIVKSGYDPISIPDVYEGLSYKPLFITYHGELNLTAGQMEGFSTINRGKENAQLSYDTSTKKMEIISPLNIQLLDFHYIYVADIMNLGPRGTVTGKINNLQMRIILSFDFKKFVASLDELFVINSGFISLKFTGNIFIDWLINLLTTVATTALHRVILLFIENTIRTEVTDIVNLINKSIENFINANHTQVDNEIYKLFV